MIANARTTVNDSGAAAVELALILPILILIVFGIIEFGRAYDARISLQHAVREGVRVWALTQDAGQATTATINAATSIALEPGDVAMTSCNRGQPTALTASFDFEYLAWSFGPEPTLTATGVMRCGG